MQRRGRSSAWRWALLAALLAVPVADAAPPNDEVYGWDSGAESRAAGQASQGFLDAFRATDERAMDRIASARTPDAVIVLAALLASHVRAALETPPKPGDYLPAARAFVARSKGNPAARGTTELLATWEAFRREDLERELRLKDGSRALERKGDPEACERDLAKIAALDADMAVARGSVSATMLGIERGRCLRVLQRDATVAAARTARTIAVAVPWPLGAARAARLQALECLRLGDLDGAVEATRVITRVHRDIGDLTMASMAENRLSRLLRLGARYDEALVASRQAAVDARAAGRENLLADAWVGEASVHAQVGRGAEVVRLATDAAALFRKVGDASGEAGAWTTLATDHVLHDRFAEALLACDRAKEALGRTSEGVVTTLTWTNIGIAHRRLGRLDLALEDQRSALAEAERMGDPVLIGLARGNLGLVEADLEMPTARATLERALKEKRAARDGEGAWDTELALANYLARRTQTTAEGRQRLGEVAQEARRLGDPFRLAVALDALANAAERVPDAAAALPLALEAAAIYVNLGERSVRAARVHELLARLYLADGKPAQSLEASLRAVALRRSGLAGLGEEDATAQGQFVRIASDGGLEAALAWSPSEPDRAAAGAFELLEGARAALLTAGIVNAEAFLAAEVPEAARAAEAASRARVEASRARYVELYRGQRPPAATATAAARADLDRAWTAHEQAVARIRREETRAAGVAFPQPVALAEFQRTLAKDAAYVAFQVTPKHVVALVVTRERARMRDLGPSEGLAARVEGWLRLASTPGADDTGAAAALYDALLRPLEEDVKGRAALVVSPDGPLSFAPLEALVRTDGRSATRALERWTVSYVPSASVLTALRAESAKLPAAAGFVGLGDPDHTPRPGTPSATPPDLPPLPASAAEVREVAAVYPAATRTILLGAKASRADLLAALASRGKRVRALHLATHAFLDPERPRRSCLVLAGGDVLDVDAIHRLRVPADLAVLSACGTGRGALVAGEGVSGLARGFFIAGVPRVVVSAWVVSDASTAPVLVAFHRGVEADKKPYAAALRAAKLAALARGGASAHPSTWAAFTLWGLPE